MRARAAAPPPGAAEVAGGSNSSNEAFDTANSGGPAVGGGSGSGTSTNRALRVSWAPDAALSIEAIRNALGAFGTIEDVMLRKAKSLVVMFASEAAVSRALAGGDSLAIGSATVALKRVGGGLSSSSRDGGESTAGSKRPRDDSSLFPGPVADGRGVPRPTSSGGLPGGGSGAWAAPLPSVGRWGTAPAPSSSSSTAPPLGSVANGGAVPPSTLAEKEAATLQRMLAISAARKTGGTTTAAAVAAVVAAPLEAAAGVAAFAQPPAAP